MSPRSAGPDLASGATDLPPPAEAHDGPFPGAFDPRLFTPGPLTTSPAVRQAMLHDIGAWDAPVRAVIAEIRSGLLRAAGQARGSGWEVTLMQGSGTFCVESALGSLTPRRGRVVIASNGAYGERMIRIAKILGLDVVPLLFPESQPVSADAVALTLADHPDAHTVGLVHCETTTGLVNDVAAVGRTVRGTGRAFLVDAMSSFGAYPLDFAADGIDILVSSANKCLEGVPGFGFVFARRAMLEQSAAEGWARSHSLDLADQWRGFEQGGKFRFTPPTHVLLAFRQALREFFAEGGVPARMARYQANHRTLLAGMRGLGFVPYLPERDMSHIITTFLCPADPRYDFEEFYGRLARRGLVIYPGKVSQARCFRIGNIGRLYPRDMEALVLAIGAVTREMGFDPGAVTPA